MKDLLIRIANDRDLPALTELYNYYVCNTAISFDLSPFSLEQRREWFKQYSPEGRYRLLVAQQEGQIVGYVTSSPFRVKAAYETSVETSIYLNPELTGRGIGKELYLALFDFLQEEDVHRAYAGITLPNAASIALHRKLGFRAIGIYEEVGRKFDKYWDVQWYEKKLS
jgi:phosphinothricin acetyltransferase